MLRFDEKSISSQHIVFLKGEKQTSKMQGRLESRRGSEVKYLVFLRGQNLGLVIQQGDKEKKVLVLQYSVVFRIMFLFTASVWDIFM